MLGVGNWCSQPRLHSEHPTDGWGNKYSVLVEVLVLKSTAPTPCFSECAEHTNTAMVIGWATCCIVNATQSYSQSYLAGSTSYMILIDSFYCSETVLPHNVVRNCTCTYLSNLMNEQWWRRNAEGWGVIWFHCEQLDQPGMEVHEGALGVVVPGAPGFCKLG